MTNFPADDAPLTEDTFNTAYNVLSAQIQQETPNRNIGGGNEGTINLENLGATNSGGQLDRWRTYTKDGDLSQLPTTGGAATPWQYLVETSKQKLSPAQSDLQNVHDQLVSRWTGPAAGKYEVYVQEMQKRLNNYSMEGGHLDQVAALLKAAFAVEVAFKKDLLETARAASKALDALEHGQALADFGLFCVGLAGLALSQLGAFDAGITVAGYVFTKGVVNSLVSGFSFNDIKDKGVAVDGDNVGTIINNFDAAVSKIVSSYPDAAKQVSDKLNALIDDLQGEAKGITTLPNVPDMTDPTAGFKLSSFFPDTASQDTAIYNKIDGSTQ